MMNQIVKIVYTDYIARRAKLICENNKIFKEFSYSHMFWGVPKFLVPANYFDIKYYARDN